MSREMVESQRRAKATLHKLLKLDDNATCADCGAKKPNWCVESSTPPMDQKLTTSA